MIGVILVGGKGTRLGELAQGLPKPMVPLAGKPLLQHHIELFRQNGITEIVLLAGYKSDVIKSHFADGSRFGVSIRYSEETEPLGTAGAVQLATPLLQSPFILLYGDCVVDMDLRRMIAFHDRKGGLATLTVHPNSHPGDSDLLQTDDSDLITGFFPKPHTAGAARQNLVNAGLYVLSPRILPLLPTGFSDFGRDIFPALLAKGEKLFGYRTTEYIKDMGTPDRLRAVEKDFLSGKCAARNLAKKQRAIFLDRDGVINEEIGLLHRAEDIRLLPGAAEAIRAINDSAFLCIVVTNQPVVARGLCDISEVQKMHNTIDTMLGAGGAFIDCWYFCPHHPDKGFSGENPLYKIPCSCRKPGIGMLTAAALKFNIDLAGSYIIGDSTRDIQTGKNAGAATILVSTGYGGSDKTCPAEPDFRAPSLTEAVAAILQNTVGIRMKPLAQGGNS